MKVESKGKFLDLMDRMKERFFQGWFRKSRVL